MASNYPDNMDWPAFDARWGNPTAADYAADAAKPKGWYRAYLAEMNSPLAIAKSNLRHAELMICSLRPCSPMREIYARKLGEYRAAVESLQVTA